MQSSVITGTGCYIPPVVQSNQDFTAHFFYTNNREPIAGSTVDVVKKFREITGINERRYITDDLIASDIGFLAAKEAINDSHVDPETIDQLIVAHNFGNVVKNTVQTDTVPSLASRIKNLLGIRNPNCSAYDILFGCAGWLQALIHADYFFKAGIARKVLIV